MGNEPNDPMTQDQLAALAWVRGEMGVSEVARAYGLPETSTNEIYRRLSEALKVYLQDQQATPPAPSGNPKR